MSIDSETRKVAPNEDLRQGDILEIEDPESDRMAPRLGVIINADCDLAHGKTDGMIAFLPVYTFRNYLEIFCIPGLLADATKAATAKVLELTRIENQHADDLCRWLISAPVEEVTAKLTGLPAVNKKSVSMLAENISRLSIALKAGDPLLDHFGRLCKLEKDPASYARKQVLAAKKSMGEGHFFISEIHGTEDVGFVVRMRRIYTLEAACCFKSIPSKMTSSDGRKMTAVRLATLTPLYQFKIAQLFAHQFSRVGLPDEISALSELAVDDLVYQLSEAMS